MFSRILVGFVDTERGHDALELGRILAQASHAELIVGTAREEAGEGLASLARREEADLVVLGSTHQGPVGRIVPGAAVAHLLGEAPCAVAVAPPGFGHRPADGDIGWRPLSGDAEDAGMRVIGVGFDGSQAAYGALSLANELALANRAALRVYAVAPKFAALPAAAAASHGQIPHVPTHMEILRDQLFEAVAYLPPEARALPVMLRGIPSDELVAATEVGVDLLFLGCREGGPLRRALHTSVSDDVLLASKCPVLISPLGVGAPAASAA